MKQKRRTKSAQRAAERRRKREIEREEENRRIHAERDRENRAKDQEEEDKLRRQLVGPCPRCAHRPLFVYLHGADLDGEDVDRVELVTEQGKKLDAEFESPECTFTVERLIYCPKCGALHEIGGETHYPQSGIVGGPQPTDAALSELADIARGLSE